MTMWRDWYSDADRDRINANRAADLAEADQAHAAYAARQAEFDTVVDGLDLEPPEAGA